MNKPSQIISQHKLYRVIFGKLQHNSVKDTFRICEFEPTNNLVKGHMMFQE